MENTEGGRGKIFMKWFLSTTRDQLQPPQNISGFKSTMRACVHGLSRVSIAAPSCLRQTPVGLSCLARQFSGIQMPSNVSGLIPRLADTPKLVPVSRLLFQHDAFPVTRLGDCGLEEEGEGGGGEGADEDAAFVGVEDFDDLPSLNLSADVFNQPLRLDLLHRVVVYQRNKFRGKRTAKTKTISEVSGSGRKMRPQKGSGRARIGHNRAAHHRGGAKAHGPKGVIQDYSTKLDKGVRRLGLKVALSQKLREGNLIIVDDFRSSAMKTRVVKTRLLKKFAPYDYSEDMTALLIGENEIDLNFRKSVKNLPKMRVIPSISANVYDVLNHKKLVLSIQAVLDLQQRLERF